MAAALEAVDTYRVTADGFGFQGVPYRGALVYDLDPCRLQCRQIGLWVATRRLDYLDATLEVCPEYKKTMRYGDTEFEEAAMQKGLDDAAEVERRWETRDQWIGKGGK